MKSVLDFLQFICFIPILCGVVSLLFIVPNIFNKRKGDSLVTDFYGNHPIVVSAIAVVCILYILFSSPLFRHIMKIYDLELCGKGDYCYYVKLDNGKKEYTLPARIRKDDDLYTIENVYWSNGGYTTR